MKPYVVITIDGVTHSFVFTDTFTMKVAGESILGPVSLETEYSWDYTHGLCNTGWEQNETDAGA